MDISREDIIIDSITFVRDYSQKPPITSDIDVEFTLLENIKCSTRLSVIKGEWSGKNHDIRQDIIDYKFH